MKVWFIEFPTYRYNEDVKDLARMNNLKIVDAKFQGTLKQCENAPTLTLKGAKKVSRTSKVSKEEK